VELKIDPAWLLMMAEKEDGCMVSVGGLVSRIELSEGRLAACSDKRLSYDFETLADSVERGAVLTPDQRAAMIEQTIWCAEGMYSDEELQRLDDRALSERCIFAMQTWAACNI